MSLLAALALLLAPALPVQPAETALAQTQTETASADANRCVVILGVTLYCD